VGHGVVEDPGTSRNSMHENREASKASVEQTDRSAKVQSRNADVYAMEESDCRVVPMKQPNKEGKLSAEAVEGRRQPKENDAQSSIQPTQSGERVSQGLSGVRRVARERKQERFTALLHHVTVNLLRESFDALGWRSIRRRRGSSRSGASRRLIAGSAGRGNRKRSRSSGSRTIVAGTRRATLWSGGVLCQSG
jgi:hypothetical protein